MSKYDGTIFDSDVPVVVKVSRVSMAIVLSLCAMATYMILAI